MQIEPSHVRPPRGDAACPWKEPCRSVAGIWPSKSQAQRYGHEMKESGHAYPCCLCLEDAESRGEKSIHVATQEHPFQPVSTSKVSLLPLKCPWHATARSILLDQHEDDTNERAIACGRSRGLTPSQPAPDQAPRFAATVLPTGFKRGISGTIRRRSSVRMPAGAATRPATSAIVWNHDAWPVRMVSGTSPRRIRRRSHVCHCRSHHP